MKTVVVHSSSVGDHRSFDTRSLSGASVHQTFLTKDAIYYKDDCQLKQFFGHKNIYDFENERKGWTIEIYCLTRMEIDFKVTGVPSGAYYKGKRFKR